MNIWKKILGILALIILSALFIYFNLLKGVAGSSENPFSVKNIILTGLFFGIGIPVLIIIDKILGKGK